MLDTPNEPLRPSGRRAKSPTERIVRLANREIVTVGLQRGFWSDLHHRAVTVRWPKFFAAAALIFLAFNVVFAAIFGLGDKPVANVRPGNWLDLFFFSIETLATVGYGDMHPQTLYGHLVATVEIFTGMSLLAVFTGLVFTRFSQPRAKFLFATSPIIGVYDGSLTLMIRVANARQNMIAGAKAKLWLVRNEVSAEGHQMRRFHELPLLRRENPVFALSWTVFHRIDATSLLDGLTAEDLAASETALVLIVTGLDESSAQDLHARHTYNHENVRWGHRYANIISNGADGRVRLDYGRFHDVEPESP